MTGLLIVMQRHIIVQIIRKRVRNLANYISSGPSCLGPGPAGRLAGLAVSGGSTAQRGSSNEDEDGPIVSELQLANFASHG